LRDTKFNREKSRSLVVYFRPEIPTAFSFKGRISCDTVSNAFWKSIKIGPTDKPLSIASFHFSVMVRSKSSEAYIDIGDTGKKKKQHQ